MSSEQTERRIEFIIEQQAKFVEDISRLERQSMENTANIGKLTDVMLSLTNVVQRHDDQIGALVESGKDTDARLKALAESGKETDARLDALITLFERSMDKGL
jgi:chromosome segregation ATPase